jgi:2-oxoglutarate ferredoxin oxidoreductase subunit alpha
MSESICIRFAGDSGDGMQLLGQQFTYSAVEKGWQVQTLPDFPAEIRAPVGTTAGVSGVQVTLADIPIYVSNDLVDVLVILNPAALKTSLPLLKKGGLLFVNADNFKKKDLTKAGYDTSPLEDGSLSKYKIVSIPITTRTLDSLNETTLAHSKRKKAKNFYVLGMVLWLFQLETKVALSFIQHKFGGVPELSKANQIALKSGFNFAMTLELSHFKSHSEDKNKHATKNERYLSGVKAISHALAAYAFKSTVPMLVSGYPITPASSILHEAAKLSHFGVNLFQAEDEIAAICASIGAAFSGHLAVTCTSGPGLDLKAEGLGLAVMSELPVLVIDVQRAGPSTGLPTKTEQSDLNLALYGRHGEAPLPVIAPKTASDCFKSVIEALNIAIEFMTPVILLCDAYLANASELWTPPDPESLPIKPPVFNAFKDPYERNEKLSRSWIVPGSKGLQHCLGGLEKKGSRGGVTYDPIDHQEMVTLRKNKINNIQISEPFIYAQDPKAEALIISWGSTYGSVQAAITELKNDNVIVNMLHLRQLFPLPKGLSDIFKDNTIPIIVAELNEGQLCALIRSTYLVHAVSLSQTSGQPFSISTLVSRIRGLL